MKYFSIAFLIILLGTTVEAACRRKRVLVQERVVILQRSHFYSTSDAQLIRLLIQAELAKLGRAPFPVPPVKGGDPVKGGGVKQSPPPTQRIVVGSYQEPQLVQVVKDSCFKCHGSGSKNGVLMLDGKLADISERLAWKAFGLVNSGKMPKASEALKDDKAQLFYDWAEAQEGKK